MRNWNQNIGVHHSKLTVFSARIVYKDDLIVQCENPTGACFLAFAMAHSFRHKTPRHKRFMSHKLRKHATNGIERPKTRANIKMLIFKKIVCSNEILIRNSKTATSISILWPQWLSVFPMCALTQSFIVCFCFYFCFCIWFLYPNAYCLSFCWCRNCNATVC